MTVVRRVDLVKHRLPRGGDAQGGVRREYRDGGDSPPGGGDAQKGPVLAMATENPGGGDAHKTRLRRRGRPRSARPPCDFGRGRARTTLGADTDHRPDHRKAPG